MRMKRLHKMFKSSPAIFAGDRVGVDQSQYFNHGCSDSAVLEIEEVVGESITARVIDVNNCHSCWQVGHDASHVFAQVGGVWKFDRGQLALNEGSRFAISIRWELVG